MVDDLKTYDKARNGLLPPDSVDARLISRYNKNGLLSTSVVQGEGIDSAIATIKGAVGKPAEIMDWAYSWGDGVPKLNEALRQGRKLYKMLDEVGDGRYIEVEYRPGHVMRLTKRGGDIEMTPIKAGGKRFSNPTSRTVPMNDPQIDRIIGDASAVPAQDIFFDYTDVPNYVKRLRSNSLTGIASPFVTWSYKAMDLPGKPGLLTKVLSGEPMIATNDPKIFMRQSGQQMALATRRAATMSALRQDVIDNPENRALLQWIAFDPRGSGIGTIAAISDPNIVRYKDWPSANWAGPTDTLFRVGMGVLDMFRKDPTDVPELFTLERRDADGKRELIPIDVNTLTPEQRKQRKRVSELFVRNKSGGMWAAADVLELTGMMGHPLSDLIQEIQDKGITGIEVGSTLYRNLAPMLLSGAGAAVMDIGLGMIDPTSQYTTRSKAVDAVDQRLTEDIVRWSIRRLSGLGYKQALLETIKYGDKDVMSRYQKGVKQAYQKNAIAPLEQKVKRLQVEANKNPQDQDALNRLQRAQLQLAAVRQAWTDETGSLKRESDEAVNLYRKAMKYRSSSNK
jgi:hypothetical protein